MSNPHEGFDRFLAAAKRGSQNAGAKSTGGDSETPAPAFATRVAAAWAAEKPDPWWLAPFNRAAPWAAISLVAIVVGVAAICRNDYGASARLADAMICLVADEPESSPF